MSCGKNCLPPVVEIKNEPCPVEFLTTEVEGTLEENPPVVGGFRNVLAAYKGSKAKVLYSSDGIPSVLSDDGGSGGVSDFNELEHRPKYDGQVMTGNTDIPEVPSIISDTDFDNLWEGE